MAMLNNQRVSICAMVKTWHTSTPIWITGINRTGDAAVCQNAQHKSPRFKNMAVIIYLRHLSIHPSILQTRKTSLTCSHWLRTSLT